jgi:hypothetical protein
VHGRVKRLGSCRRVPLYSLMLSYVIVTGIMRPSVPWPTSPHSDENIFPYLSSRAEINRTCTCVFVILQEVSPLDTFAARGPVKSLCSVPSSYFAVVRARSVLLHLVYTLRP